METGLEEKVRKKMSLPPTRHNNYKFRQISILDKKTKLRGFDKSTTLSQQERMILMWLWEDPAGRAIPFPFESGFGGEANACIVKPFTSLTLPKRKRSHGFVITKHEMENKMVTEQTHILIVTGNHVPKGHLNKKNNITSVNQRPQQDQQPKAFCRIYIYIFRTWWQTQYVGSFGSIGCSSIRVKSFRWLPGGGMSSKSLSRSHSLSL